jgi:hypothetical protein
MSRVSWPAALVLSVLLVCTTYLVSKGTIPSHVLFTVVGIVVGYVIPRMQGAAPTGIGALATARTRSSDEFTPEEIPTKKDLRSEAVTVARPAAKRPEKLEDEEEEDGRER